MVGEVNAAIRAGDVVILRGGGPRLTVSSIEYYDGKQHVNVYWFVEGDELKSHIFSPDALIHAE